MKRLLLFALLALLLSACAATKSSMFEKGMRFQVMNPYVEIKYDFERGRIMQARLRVLALDKEQQDYAVAHRYLKKTIEPARRRLFVHYLRTAKRLERAKRWADAMEAYTQAKSVTIKPEVMEKKRSEMEFRMRQLRLDRLLKLRRNEDSVWLGNLPAYEPPHGLSGKDDVYQHQREVYLEGLDERADAAYQGAKFYLRRDQPEIAYVEVESHLRLQPDSGRGKRMLAEISKEMPKQIAIHGNIYKKRTNNSSKRASTATAATAEQIQTAMKRGDLLEARRLAHSYRRGDGKDAEKLLSQVQKKIEAKAAEKFTAGSQAFRKEKLDEAISYWSDSVALMPEQAEYVEALHRVRQLKERLNLLREQKDSDPVPEEE